MIETRIVDLRTSLLDRPLGLHDREPTLSWRLESTRREVSQRAYRILVASSPADLLEGSANLWDSGRIDSSDSIGIRYAGKSLTSRERACWTVTVWDDENQVCRPSQATFWEMGLLERSDWQGSWLAAEDQLERDDRVAGMTWVGASNPGDKAHLNFRLPFIAPSAGRLVLTLAATCQSRVSKLFLDDAPIEIPVVPGFVMGSPPAARLEVPISAGPHQLMAQLESFAPFPIIPPMATVGLAVQLRIIEQGGRVTRVSDGWQVHGAAARVGAADWTPARLLEEHPNVPWPPSPARLMRRAFTVRSAPRAARLYVTALGGYEMRLNGTRVSTDQLASESVDFRQCAPYRVFDVGSMILAGENVLGAIVGDGWFASYATGSGRYPWDPAPRRLLAQLELTYADGSRELIATDERWRADRAPIVSSEIYNGEEYDARLEQTAWDRVGFDDRHWSPVESIADPPQQFALIAQTSAPIRALRTLEAVAISEPSPGIHVFDFGQNFAGWARLSVTAPGGQRITLRFAEILKADGRVDQANLRMARATDVYVARGDPGGETHEPRFTYHGFRYVEMQGLEGPVSKNTIQGIVVHTDLAETGQLRIDSPLIQKLWENTLWSQRSNFVGLPTDCPQRDERLGWMGDAQIFWDAAAFNMDVAAFTRRFAADIRRGQRKDNGAFDIWAPKADETLMPLKSPTPGWADAGIVLPWTAYMRYGDRTIVDENWQAMTRYVDGILEGNPDHLWRNGRGLDLGDWLSLDAKTPWDETTPRELIATALLARSCDQLAELAMHTGRAAEVTRYRELANNVKFAFARAFVSSDGIIGNGSQSGYIIALRLDCVPPSLRPIAGQHLIAAIRERGTTLATGFLGTPFSLDAIADQGDSSLVYDLLLKIQFPSWGYMIEQGATTIWESWDNSANSMTNSRNHYALGSVCGFLYRRVAGIDPIAPGFARVRVRPVLDRRIRSAGADYDGVRGRISCHWTLEPNAFTLKVALPPTSRAIVHLPAAKGAAISESGFASRARLRTTSRDSDEAVFEIGSGTYSFTVTPLPEHLRDLHG